VPEVGIPQANRQIEQEQAEGQPFDPQNLPPALADEPPQTFAVAIGQPGSDSDHQQQNGQDRRRLECDAVAPQEPRSPGEHEQPQGA
jgi:hypothetical protein